MNYLKNTALLFFNLFVTFYFSSCSDQYTGEPYSDDKYQVGRQTIPGKIELEFYDFGGEGVAYHDIDSINSGSGRLNPADGSYLNEFRLTEGVDISYTKSKGIDDSPYNIMNPNMNQLYVGWTEPGEWLKYSISVKSSGRYQVGLMYTSYGYGQISLSIDDVDVSGILDITSTFAKADTIKWRQYHHWSFNKNLTEIDLTKGDHTLTLHTVTFGQMNYDFMSFDLLQY
jgi:hypothetical protein